MSYYTIQRVLGTVPGARTYEVSKHTDSTVETYTIVATPQLWTCSCPAVSRLRRGQLCKHSQLVQHWLAAGQPPTAYTISGTSASPKFAEAGDLSALLGE